MDLADEDGDRPGRGRLLARQISAEAVVLLDTDFDQLAERRQAGEVGRALRQRRRQRSLRRKTDHDDQDSGDHAPRDHSTFKFSFLIKVDHLVSSLSTSAAYSAALEVSGSPPSR